MNQSKEAQPKTLFVGNKRICQQIAYVLDIKDYAFAEKLTKQNYDQYCDCQIYVCDFKRKSRKFVQLKDKASNQLNIQYLDDICRKIDDEYYANRKRHENDLQKPVTEKTPTKSVVAATTTEQVVQPVDVIPTKPSLLKRICRGMKHPLRAGWHVVLRTKETIKRQYYTVKQKRAVAREHPSLRKLKQLIRQDIWYLQRLKPSELLLYVLRAPIKKNIRCTIMEDQIYMIQSDYAHETGNISGCCSAVVPFGNLLRDGELHEVYHSTYARIVKLSSLNRSYCLCNFNTFCKGYCSQGGPLPTEKWETSVYPTSFMLGFDRSCNLCCKSCRAKPYVMDETAQQRANVIVEKLLRSGYLEQTQKLIVAGMGEVFYSPYYRRLLTTDLQRKNIEILSNGTLFNASNWQLVAGKYAKIRVQISVDGATAETNQKLRGLDFNQLMKNLTMIGDLRRRGQIRWFKLNFVVQRENFREMPAYVQLGKSLGVDRINFQRLNNLGTFTPQEFNEQALIIDNQYLDYDLWCVLQEPIFQDPIVDLRLFSRYIDASEKRYRQRYEREQKAKRSV